MAKQSRLEFLKQQDAGTLLIQTLSAKLGIAAGKNLAELCRIHFSPKLTFLMWGVMEIVVLATDLAEFVGAAIGFNLLFGVPLWVAGMLTAVATFMILGLERYGFRPLEAVIGVLVGIIGAAYLVETILDKPEWGSVLYHSVVPQFSGPESVLLATGILGATVMPHAIFLHSALTQGRIIVKDPVRARRLFHKAKADLIVLGTHGKTGTNVFWSGSTAPRVCAGCDVPILLVPVTQ